MGVVNCNKYRYIINKTSLRPVSRPVEQFSLLKVKDFTANLCESSSLFATDTIYDII